MDVTKMWCLKVADPSAYKKPEGIRDFNGNGGKSNTNKEKIVN